MRSDPDAPRRGPLTRLHGIARELTVLRHFEASSWPRLVGDILLFRVMRFGHVPREDAGRTVRMRDGTVLTYRLNRGDIQALREIWEEDVYLPEPELAGRRHVVDLGANIGFTSVYLSRRLTIDHLIAVEPDPANVAILRRNLQQNGIRATVLHAAVGRVDGHAAFRRARASNVGQLDVDGDFRVQVVSMRSVIDRLPDTDTDTLLKMDIEGGEEQLFAGDVSWLRRFDCVMAELHPQQVDMPRIIATIETSGLRPRAGRGLRQCARWVRP